jgi:hypothetical protein
MWRRFIRRCAANRGYLTVAIGCAAVLYLFGPRPAELTGARPWPFSGEVRISKALAGKADLDFTERPLADAVAEIARTHRIEIQLDRKAMAKEGIADDTPVTRHVRDVSLRSALRLVLDDLDMTYVVRDGYLLLTTEAAADGMLSVNAYPARDLVGSDEGLCPSLVSGTKLHVAHDDLENLLDVITSTIQPTTWEDVGGPGSVKEVDISDALVISQTDAVHEEIATLLDALRVVRDKQVAAAQAIVGTWPARPVDSDMRLTAYWLTTGPMATTPPGKSSSRNSSWGDGVTGDGSAADGTGQQAKSSPAGPPPASLELALAKYEKERAAAKAGKMAALLTQLIEPESWQPRGEGVVRVADDAIVVRQTEAIQRQVAMLLSQMAPGRVVYWQPDSGPPSLSVGGPRRSWPAQAEPQTEWASAIEQSLAASADLDVSSMPLKDVLEQLGAEHHLPLQFDKALLTSAPVTRRVRGIALRELLKLLLDEFDLAYVVGREVLFITSQEEAESMLTTKVYPVFDLACRPLTRAKLSPDAGARRWCGLMECWAPAATCAVETKRG